MGAESEEQKIEEKVKAINLTPSAAESAAAAETSQEEEEKADAFKAAGNEFFKGKQPIFSLQHCFCKFITHVISPS